MSVPARSSGSDDVPPAADAAPSADSIDVSALGEVAEPYEEPVEDDRPDFVPEPRRDLKAEPSSLRHILLHDFKKPRCRVCNEMVAQSVSNRRRHDVEAFANFGDMITMDHAISSEHVDPQRSGWGA